MGDITKVIEISGDNSGYVAALDSAEKRATDAAARVDKLDQQLADKKRARDEAQTMAAAARTNDLIKREYDVRAAGLDKEVALLKTALDKQVNLHQQAVDRVSAVKAKGQQLQLAQAARAATAAARAEESFAARGALQFGRNFTQGSGLSLPFLGGSPAGIAGAIAGTAVAFTFKTAIGDTVQWAETIHNLSVQAQAGAREISTLAAVADRYGITTDRLQTSLQMLASAVADYPEQLHAMGVATEDASGKTRPLLDIFNDVRKVIAGASGDSDTLRVAQELFGRGVSDLLPLLRASQGEIDAMTASVQDSGKVIDEQGIAKAREWQIETAQLGNMWTSFTQTLGGIAIPFAIRALQAYGQAFDTLGTMIHNALGGNLNPFDAINEAQSRHDAQVAEQHRIASELATSALSGGGATLPTRASLAGAQKAAADAIKKSIDDARDALERFTRTREDAIRVIEDEQRASDKAHQAELDALDAEQKKRDRAYTQRERTRRDELDGLREQIRLIDQATQAEDAQARLRTDTEDAQKEKFLAGQISREQYKTEDEYQQAVFKANQRVRDSDKKVADDRKTIAKDAQKQILDDRIAAIEHASELDKRAQEDFKAQTDDKVAQIKKQQAAEKDASDAKIQHLRDEVDAEKRQTDDLIKELQKKADAAAAYMGGLASGLDVVRVNANNANDAVIRLQDSLTNLNRAPDANDRNQGSGGVQSPDAKDRNTPGGVWNGQGASPRTIDDIRKRVDPGVGGGWHDYPHTMTLTEPTALIGLASGTNYGTAAATGSEDISFGGVGGREMRVTVDVRGLSDDASGDRVGRAAARALRRELAGMVGMGAGRKSR